jgi:hypothetical protein
VEVNRLGSPVTWGFSVERVTGIEPALSAWDFIPVRANGLLAALSRLAG